MLHLTQREYVSLGYPTGVPTYLPILIDPYQIKAIGAAIHTDTSMGTHHRLDGSWIQYGNTPSDSWLVRETPDEVMAIWEAWKSA